MASFIDDKSPLVIPFITSLLSSRAAPSTDSPRRPLIIGLNGLQGIGKTTLVASLATALSPTHRTLVLSIDDFYLPRARQLALAAAHPDNALVQTRGEPGTHDLPLAARVLADLCAARPTRIPRYDKAAFSGRGDRLPEDQWLLVNGPADDKPVQAVILEGWCVGFRALPPAQLEARWRSAVARAEEDSSGGSTTTATSLLARHALEHLALVNDALADYDALTDLFDAFVHVDAEDLSYVYAWREEQEAALRKERGTGMTPEEVVSFVDGYFPAYELYCEGVRKGVLRGPGAEGRQLRIVVGRDRKVKESYTI